MAPETPDGNLSGLRPAVAAAGRVVTSLAALPPDALIDEQALARAFGITQRTVRRMVNRHELPPPVALAGRATWLAGRVLAHIRARAERAARKAEKEALRLETLSTGAME